ncbi:MAG: penicillin-binding transpeptidase domain-containing protein [Deltaproteobacteria bacterium]|nr:penicillin-binding transpeptidase domain-containing protein [Deltaproteobacteria bacterium]
MHRRGLSLLAVSCALLGAVPGVLLARRVADAQRRSPDTRLAQEAARTGATASATPAPRVTSIERPVAGFDPSHARRLGDRYVSELPGDRRAVLTLEPAWQRGVSALLAAHQLPRASVVVLDSDTGRVRVYASHGEPGAPDLARDAAPPAASVFKIVTAGALAANGMSVETETCFSGGWHRLSLRDLEPNPRRDSDCVSLGQAFGRSANTVFARRSVERLSPAALLAAAHSWGYGESVPFEATVSAGQIDMPSDRLEFARASAGFWHSHLSPLHGAVIAQGIARGGELQRPWIIDRIEDAQGAVVAQHEAPRAWRRAVSHDVASALTRMMAFSVSEGTASRAFRDPHGHPFLPGVDVGGKTGTLTAATPYRAYTWFVGNAHDSTTRVSFAVMVANDPVWRVKASTVARQVLQIVYRGRSTD